MENAQIESPIVVFDGQLGIGGQVYLKRGREGESKEPLKTGLQHFIAHLIKARLNCKRLQAKLICSFMGLF